MSFDEEDLDLLPIQLDDKYNPEGDGQHPHFTRDQWREAVTREDTLSGYWDWVHHQIQNFDLEDLL